MIQDIEPKFLNNQYQSKVADDSSLILCFRERNAYIIKTGEKAANGKDIMTFPTLGQVKEAYGVSRTDLPEVTYLFSIDDDNYFLCDISDEAMKLLGGELIPMFDVRALAPKHYVMAASTGYHLYVWYRDNNFCGRCGAKTVHHAKLRAKQCPDCGNMIFPKICPAVIVGVTHGDYILMTKYAGREYKRYALIAGFIEIGETGEACVQREVLEEVGLKVKNVTYYNSQPWGFDSDLLLGYYCELDDSEVQKIKLDEDELSTAEWVHYKDIPEDYEGLSLTADMMNHFKEIKENR